MSYNHIKRVFQPLSNLDLSRIGISPIGLGRSGWKEVGKLSREHTKPLFTEYNLLAVRNLYHYFCTVDVFKILKFRKPITPYEMYQKYHCETSLALILPEHSGSFSIKVHWHGMEQCLQECPRKTQFRFNNQNFTLQT